LRSHSSLLTWDVGRAFLDLARSGCGSGCTYCYIDAPLGTQILATMVDVDNALELLMTDPRFARGPSGTLISISPGSEPLKSSQSLALVLRMLQALLPFGNPVQIPTKEPVPTSLVKCLDKYARYAHQVVIFVSLSTISNASRLEPHAAPIETRLANAQTLRGHSCHSCAYIKPFLRSALGEVDDFVTFLNRAAFDSICVGMRYYADKSKSAARTSHALPVSSRPHPIKPDHLSQGLSQHLLNFYRQLRLGCAPTPVFLTSPCVNAYLLDREPPIPVWRDLPTLCVQCRTCGQEGPR
jgi:DNA repair photolyase